MRVLRLKLPAISKRQAWCRRNGYNRCFIRDIAVGVNTARMYAETGNRKAIEAIRTRSQNQS